MLFMRRYEPKDTIAAVSSASKLELVYQETESSPEAVTVWEIRTFRALNSSDPGVILRPINDFFATMSVQEHAKLYNWYVACKHHLEDLRRRPVDAVVADISRDTAQVFHELKLVEKLTEFTQAGNIPVPDLSEAGQRAHDSPEMTFTKEHYMPLQAIAVACKMMGPIWAEFAPRSASSMTDIQRDVTCCGFLGYVADQFSRADVDGPLHHPLWVPLMEKLEYYTNNRIATFIDGNSMDGPMRSLTTARAYRGMSDAYVLEATIAHNLVRKLTNINFYPTGDKPSNALRFLVDGIVRFLNTITGSTFDQRNNNGVSMEVRGTPKNSDAVSLSEEEVVSTLEVDSQVSETSADIPEVIAYGTELLIARQTEVHPELLQAALGYYKISKIQLNPFNQMLVASRFATRLGGSRSIQILRYTPYTQLLILTQAFLFSHKLFQAGHLMSAIPLQSNGQEMSMLNHRISTGHTMTEQYALCAAMFPLHTPSRLSFARTMTDVVNKFTQTRWAYNTSPELAAAYSANPHEQARLAPLIYDENIIREINQALLLIHGSKDAK